MEFIYSTEISIPPAQIIALLLISTLTLIFGKIKRALLATTSLAGIGFIFGFFSTLVGEEGPRIPGVKPATDTAGKDSSVCFLKILSALLAFFRFLRCLFLLYPIHLFQ